jgi:hypothetical protein
MNTNIYVGLDLGQKGDYTAIAVVEEWEEAVGGVDPVTFEARKARWLDVRYLERIPLGTSYPEIVERVCELVRSPELKRKCTLLVDATGVGVPVVDLLRRAALECCMVPVTITGGEHAARGPDGWRVPKRDLVTAVQVALELGELRLPAEMPLGRALVTELMDMRVKISDSGRDTYGAFRNGSHDDLVLALGLACWRAGRGSGWARQGRLPIG